MAGAAPVTFPEVTPGRRIEFPADEGSHAEFRIEWWYVTGWVEDEGGRARGFQVTFFRRRADTDDGNPSAFAPRQFIVAHAAVSDPRHGRLRHAERAARAGFGLAEARTGRTDVVLEDWSLVQQGDTYRARVRAADFALALDFRRTQPPLLQGSAGFSQKGPDPRSASYYYSLPQLAVSGEVTVEGRAARVTGHAWLDHEWSSRILDASAVGWDWVGINLADGGALMLFRLRDGKGAQHWAGGAYRDAAGRSRTLSPADIEWTPGRRWRSPRTGIEYPVEWRVRAGGLDLQLRPLMDDQESDSRRSTGTIYWEGAVEALDARGQRLGRGYLELTGYGSRPDV